MCLYAWELLTVSHQLSVFSVHWSGARENLSYLIFHVTSQDRTIEEPQIVLNGSFSLYSTILPNLVAITTLGMKIKSFNLSSDLTNYVIKGSYDFLGRSPSR